MSLTCRYLGFELKNPFIVGACPLSEEVDSVRRLEDAGAAAVVMYSLFEEQINNTAVGGGVAADDYDATFAEAVSSSPQRGCLDYGVDRYVEQLAALKEAVSIPVFGSFNGGREGSWVQYSRLIEQAGADALELNLYFLPVDPAETSASIEDRCLRIVESVRAEVNLPVAVKLSPSFASLPNFVSRLVGAGADGIVLFNRFYQPDIDLTSMRYEPTLALSTSAELPHRLRLLAILHGRVEADLVAAGGVHTGADAIKAILSGASCVQVVSTVLREGPAAVSRLIDEMRAWMEEKDFNSVEQLCGSMSLHRYPHPEAIERANYLRVLKSWRPDRAE